MERAIRLLSLHFSLSYRSQATLAGGVVLEVSPASWPFGRRLESTDLLSSFDEGHQANRLVLADYRPNTCYAQSSAITPSFLRPPLVFDYSHRSDGIDRSEEPVM